MRLVSFIWEILQQNSPPFWPKDDRDFFEEKKWREKGGGMEWSFASLFADL